MGSAGNQVVLGALLLNERPGLRTCLQAVPSLEFSEKGRANLCQRFRLTDDELTAVLLAFRPPRP